MTRTLVIISIFLMCFGHYEARKRYRRKSGFSDFTYYYLEEKCGDVTIKADSVCFCNGTYLGKVGNSDKYCCANGKCRTALSADTRSVDKDGNCPNGITKDKSESCQQSCYNSYEERWTRTRILLKIYN